jgi:hypothetical protein
LQYICQHEHISARLFLDTKRLKLFYSATILKKEDYFLNKCENITIEGEIYQDCTERGKIFNDIYTTANLAYAASTVLVGIIADKFGMVPARAIASRVATDFLRPSTIVLL